MRTQNTNKDRAKETIEYLKKILFGLFSCLYIPVLAFCVTTPTVIEWLATIRFRCCDIATVSSAVFSCGVSTILYASVEHGEFVRFLNRIVVDDLKRLQSESVIRFEEC